jgi:hypothetical protein
MVSRYGRHLRPVYCSISYTDTSLRVSSMSFRCCPLNAETVRYKCRMGYMSLAIRYLFTTRSAMRATLLCYPVSINPVWADGSDEEVQRRFRGHQFPQESHACSKIIASAGARRTSLPSRLLRISRQWTKKAYTRKWFGRDGCFSRTTLCDLPEQ